MSSSRDLAIAFDVGTTTIAASLLDRRGGARLATAGSLNPQREFGADVVARLQAACSSPVDRQRLQDLLTGELERLARELLTRADVPSDRLGMVALAGNPAMEHLLLGLPVSSLAYPPFRPGFTASRRTTTVAFGWDLQAEVLVFPLPGAFVGGDLVAFLHDRLGAEASEGVAGPARLFLDLGTNGEMALAGRGGLYATSVAAGPAFEGGNLSCGMAALPGAINGVSIEEDRVTLTTIGAGPPSGICGSAVIDTVAELLRAGVLDHTGRIRTPEEIPSNLANRIMQVDGLPAFVLHRDSRKTVYLSQQDVRQVQLAKGAVRAGMEMLFRRSGISHDDLEEVILTGSFGAELCPASLKNVGVFTGNMVKIASFVRDGALAGVERALCQTAGFDAVELLARMIRVIPLSGNPAFEKIFIEQMDFPISTE